MNSDELLNRFEQITAYSDVMWEFMCDQQVNVLSWIGLHHSSQILECNITFNAFKNAVQGKKFGQ